MRALLQNFAFFFSYDTSPTEFYTLSLHDALPICMPPRACLGYSLVQILFTLAYFGLIDYRFERSEEHTSELQSRPHLVCRLLLEKKNCAACWKGCPETNSSTSA